MREGDAVQFNETHKWAGCMGFVAETKELSSGTRYMVGIPVPNNGEEPCGTAYIFAKRGEFERIGRAALIAGMEDEEDG